MELKVQHTTSADGIDIAYAVAGAGSPVILVPEPGISLIDAASVPEWSSWLVKLALSHQAVLIDGRGFGSSSLASVLSSPDEMVEDIRAVAAAIGLPSAVLLARGLNSKVALKLAAEESAIVSHLVLVAPVLGNAQIVEPGPAEEGGVAVQSAWDNWVEDMVGTTKHLSHSDRESRQKFSDISRGASQQKLRAMQDVYATMDGYALAEAVSSPALVLIDEAETPEARDEMSRAADAISGAERAEISLGTWMLFEDTEEQILEKLEGFFSAASPQ